MVENLANGVVKQFRTEDVDTLPRDGSVTLLDVRTPREYAGGHIEGFRLIPFLKKDKKLYGSCICDKNLSENLEVFLCFIQISRVLK